MKGVSSCLVCALLWLVPACSGAAGPGRAGVSASGGPPGAALYAKGVESADREDFSRAEQYFAAAVGQGYPEGRVLPRLVRVCLASGRLRTALRYAEPYLLRHPDEPGLLQLIAVLRFSLGDATGARTALEHAMAVDPDPDRAQAGYLLAIVLRDGFHDADGAAREFSAYLAAVPTGEHAPEARSFLEEHATARGVAPMDPQHRADSRRGREGGESGSRGSSSTHATVASRAPASPPR